MLPRCYRSPHSEPTKLFANQQLSKSANAKGGVLRGNLFPGITAKWTHQTRGVSFGPRAPELRSRDQVSLRSLFAASLQGIDGVNYRKKLPV